MARYLLFIEIYKASQVTLHSEKDQSINLFITKANRSSTF
jgi:hypothetical protein